ncbi:L-threonylcarbamoyladenylate synthase [Enterococcus faecium]|uniref:L-threonylcarbamoyladenylate synthase n=1 Tax=Enterococcus faecium TaxID=1352 RepID=UPI0011D208D4|nr:L-threonylcarbamoyladenylate synthase [Enterococcus faecium]
METKRYDETELQEAAEALKEGELVAFPTETVYGLGANALLPNAVKKVFSVKGRPQDNPLIVHVASFEQVKEYVDNFHPAAEKIVKNFWPGPLTLIFKIKKDTLPSVVTGGLSTAAFRIPDNKKTLEVIELSGVPLVGPSANTSGKPSPTTADHVYHDLQGKITGIIDDGATRIGVESTVLDLSDPTAMPMILRPGAVTKEQIEAVIESPVAIDQHLVKENETPKAPGMKYKHYSPDTRVLMVRDGDWSTAVQWAKNKKIRAGVIASPEIADQVRTDTAAVYMYNDNSVEAAAKGLFAGLRGLDEPTLGLDLIFVQVYPETGLGNAYMNRLKKAAGKNYFEK